MENLIIIFIGAVIFGIVKKIIKFGLKVSILAVTVYFLLTYGTKFLMQT